MQYKLINRFDENNNQNTLGGILRFNNDNTITSIPINLDNTDYKAYLKWVSECNTPEQAD